MPDYFHPIRIAIDGNEANCLHRVGSNSYAFEIINAMADITNTNRRQFHLTILLAAPPVGDLPPARANLNYQVLTPSRLWTQWALPRHLFANPRRYDVFFTPGHYAPRLSPIPYVSSVMDLAFLKYPAQFRPDDLFQLQNWTKYSVKKASKIVAISNFTKQEIERTYHRSAKDILVAYPALGKQPAPVNRQQQQKILASLHLHDPYFLYLGTLQPRKNLLNIIEAFENFGQQMKQVPGAKNVQLVLAGKKGWLTEEIEHKVDQSRYRHRIVMTGFVGEMQKNVLLQHALATLNLGFYEGFGIPALESLAAGTIPLVANNSSLPEVVGQAGIKVDPFSPAAITKEMIKIYHLNKTKKQKYLAAGKKQLAKFSYQKSANEILSVLSQISK